MHLLQCKTNFFFHLCFWGRDLQQIIEHTSWEDSINIKKSFLVSFTIVSFVYIFLDSSSDSSTLVYIRLDSSSDSYTLVYICLDSSSDSSTPVYIRLDSSSDSSTLVYIRLDSFSDSSTLFHIRQHSSTLV